MSDQVERSPSEPFTASEAATLADLLTAWAATLSPRHRAALGHLLAHAAVAPFPADDLAPRPSRVLTATVYDAFFVRLQETAPDLTVPDA